MQRVLCQLIESHTRIIMLADVREEYVLRGQWFPTAEHPITAR